MKKIINMTPHPINILGEKEKTLKPVGLVRLTATTERVGDVNGIPLTKTIFGEPEGLPKERDGVFYIVSQMVKSALPERRDLLVPAEVVRDEKGRIIGCKSLGC